MNAAEYWQAYTTACYLLGNVVLNLAALQAAIWLSDRVLNSSRLLRKLLGKKRTPAKKVRPIGRKR